MEQGLIPPGTVLLDSRRRHRATVRADGSLDAGGENGSIHKVGARVQGLDACNGWTFWHFEKDGELQPIDVARDIVRAALAA